MTEASGKRQVKILVTGKVQGVFYRKFTRQMALSLNICGYVQNQKNGAVLVKANGTPENIEKLISWCATGPQAAIITHIDVEEIPVTNEYFTFEVRRSD